jgi:hypothetical protein
MGGKPSGYTTPGVEVVSDAFANSWYQNNSDFGVDVTLREKDDFSIKVKKLHGICEGWITHEVTIEDKGLDCKRVIRVNKNALGGTISVEDERMVGLLFDDERRMEISNMISVSPDGLPVVVTQGVQIYGPNGEDYDYIHDYEGKIRVEIYRIGQNISYRWANDSEEVLFGMSGREFLGSIDESLLELLK